MDKKSKVLVIIFVLSLVASLWYAYYRYIASGDFLIDESQIEPEEEVVDDAEIMPEEVGEESVVETERNE